MGASALCVPRVARIFTMRRTPIKQAKQGRQAVRRTPQRAAAATPPPGAFKRGVSPHPYEPSTRPLSAVAPPPPPGVAGGGHESWKSWKSHLIESNGGYS